MPHTDIAIPTLPSRSIPATVAFYTQLGFEGGAHAFNRDYAILRRGTIELHFFKDDTLVPAQSSAGCYLRLCDVERAYRSMSAAELPRTGIPRVDALETKPWGMREFAVVD
ncbi:MAG: VOC family protein, partial [Planctomycetes bacterium]|nr:VOC family protein [Planctomycetota bacterium]